MSRLGAIVLLGSLLGSTVALADRRPAKEVITARTPAVGDTLPINGAEGWPTRMTWLYDVPSFTDATGKVVVHWFCSPKVATCVDDLARVVNLRDGGKVYVIAYLATDKKRDIKKVDPIRESEGVGNGTVAFGKAVIQLQKQWGFTGPASVVVGVDGKVALVTTGSTPTELDARDQKVTQLVSKIRDFTTSSDGPTLVKANEKFQLTMKVELASYLRYSKKAPMELKIQVPNDIKCDATTLRAEQMKIVDQNLVATATCSGPRGSYEARGTLTFSYETPGGKSTGLGTESAKWRFEIREIGLNPTPIKK